MEEVRCVSKVKHLTQRVVEKGEAYRGTFRPRPEGKPVEWYYWYCDHAVSMTTLDKENFCRFFRIVWLYAPLLFLRLKVEWLLTRHITWMVVVSIVAVAAVWAAFTNPAQLMVLAVPACVAGTSMGAYAASVIRAGSKISIDLGSINRWYTWVFLVLTAWFMPVGLVLYVLCVGAHRAVRSDTARQWIGWVRYRRWYNGRVSLMHVCLVLLYIVTTIFMWRSSDLRVIAGFLTLAPLCAVVLYLLGSMVSTAVTMRTSRRQDAREAKELARQAIIREHMVRAVDPLLRRLFVHYHGVAPSASSGQYAWWSQRYESWRVRFVDYFESQFDPEDVSRGWTLLNEYPGRTLAAYCWLPRHHARAVAGYDEEQDMPTESHLALASVPSHRVRRFLVGAREYLILLAQFVYAGKKQICPYVELPKRQ